MVKNKKTDFLFYLLFNCISTLGVLIICIIHNKLNLKPLFDIESVKGIALCFFMHFIICGFIAFQLIIEKYFFFEAFTYFSFITGVIVLTTLKNIKSDIMPGIFGCVFITLGIYLRFWLWKYDLQKDEKKKGGK